MCIGHIFLLSSQKTLESLKSKLPPAKVSLINRTPFHYTLMDTYPHIVQAALPALATKPTAKVTTPTTKVETKKVGPTTPRIGTAIARASNAADAKKAALPVSALFPQLAV